MLWQYSRSMASKFPKLSQQYVSFITPGFFAPSIHLRTMWDWELLVLELFIRHQLGIIIWLGVIPLPSQRDHFSCFLRQAWLSVYRAILTFPHPVGDMALYLALHSRNAFPIVQESHCSQLVRFAKDCGEPILPRAHTGYCSNIHVIHMYCTLYITILVHCSILYFCYWLNYKIKLYMY